MVLDQKMKKKQDAQRKHLQAFVDRFRAKASKARQAQSRIKMLAKMQPINALVTDEVRPIHFPAPDKLLSPPIIATDDVDVGYEPGHPVLSGLSLRIDNDDRIALLGSNGNGKSTLVKLLAGRLAPEHGTLTRAATLKVGYFAQHQLDELDEDRSPYDHVRDLMPEQPEAKVRAKAGAIGFSGLAANNAVKTLSGGEKARLLLGLATFAAPHLVILDEPTNHLDIDSRAALIEAINDYPGAVILVSHDRYLLEACADRLWLVAGGTVTPFDGDLDDYRRSVLVRRQQGTDRRREVLGTAAGSGAGAPRRRRQARRDGAAAQADFAGRGRDRAAHAPARQARQYARRRRAVRARSGARRGSGQDARQRGRRDRQSGRGMARRQRGAGDGLSYCTKARLTSWLAACAGFFLTGFLRTGLAGLAGSGAASTSFSRPDWN